MRKRIESALRDETTASYGALAVGGIVALLVLWAAAADAIPWLVATVLVVIVGGVTAFFYSQIRAAGLTTVINFFTTSNDDIQTDDVLEELRERLGVMRTADR